LRALALAELTNKIPIAIAAILRVTNADLMTLSSSEKTRSARSQVRTLAVLEMDLLALKRSRTF
jgi:hypothetical protein